MLSDDGPKYKELLEWIKEARKQWNEIPDLHAEYENDLDQYVVSWIMVKLASKAVTNLLATTR